MRSCSAGSWDDYELLVDVVSSLSLDLVHGVQACRGVQSVHNFRSVARMIFLKICRSVLLLSADKAAIHRLRRSDCRGTNVQTATGANGKRPNCKQSQRPNCKQS